MSTLTGLRLFHNHLSFDPVKTVFDFPSPSFLRLLKRVWLAVFEEAARERLSALIFTCVYAAPDDDALIENTIEVVSIREDY